VGPGCIAAFPGTPSPSLRDPLTGFVYLIRSAMEGIGVPNPLRDRIRLQALSLISSCHTCQLGHDQLYARAMAGRSSSYLLKGVNGRSANASSFLAPEIVYLFNVLIQPRVRGDRALFLRNHKYSDWNYQELITQLGSMWARYSTRNVAGIRFMFASVLSH